MASLMLGIDFSKTDMQVSLWSEKKTCSEIYQFSENGGEILPTMVIAKEDGTFLVAKEALDYSIKTQTKGIVSLYGNDSDKLFLIGNEKKTVNEWFAFYLREVLSLIRKRYSGASISKIGITGERMTEKKKAQLLEVMELIGYNKEMLFFSTHADASLWYEIYSGAQQGASMTLDFDRKGMLAYFVQLGNEVLKRPYYVETIDYSHYMQGSLEFVLDEKERHRQFVNLLERAIAKKTIARLYVTGNFIEQQEFITILSGYTNGGRRVFAGRALYCLGVCYHAVKEKFPNCVIGDGQIFYHVYLQAYKDGELGQVRLLKAGTKFLMAHKVLQVILDDTKELVFRIENLRNGQKLNCTFRPEECYIRENKTLRLEIELYFLDYETLILKVRDVGFGEIRLATYQVWEQMISLA